MSSDSMIPPKVDISWRNDLQAATDAGLILKLLTVGVVPPRDLFDVLFDKAQEAGEMICLYLDRYEPIPFSKPHEPPPPLRFAHSHVTVELYRRKDAPFGVLSAWSSDAEAIRVSNDPLSTVKSIINPFKPRWGIA